MTTGPVVTAKKTVNTKTPVAQKAAAKAAVKPSLKNSARKPAKAEPKRASGKFEKKPKVKMVRDFSLPRIEYEKIAEIKEACLNAGLRVKKTEVLRAGLIALGGMDEAQLKRVMAGLKKAKAGRSKKP